jgi:hypothetical protein
VPALNRHVVLVANFDHKESGFVGRRKCMRDARTSLQRGEYTAMYLFQSAHMRSLSIAQCTSTQKPSAATVLLSKIFTALDARHRLSSTSQRRHYASPRSTRMAKDVHVSTLSSGLRLDSPIAAFQALPHRHARYDLASVLLERAHVQHEHGCTPSLIPRIHSIKALPAFSTRIITSTNQRSKYLGHFSKEIRSESY